VCSFDVIYQTGDVWAFVFSLDLEFNGIGGESEFASPAIATKYDVAMKLSIKYGIRHANDSLPQPSVSRIIMLPSVPDQEKIHRGCFDR